MGPLSKRALELALSHEGVREQGGPNRGPQVEEWLKRIGLGPGFSWCAAFVWCMVDDAAEELGVKNPLPKTGGVLRMYREAPRALRSYKAQAGAIFVMDKGKGLGHTGFVTFVDHTTHTLSTIEANTNPRGSREGDGVYKRVRGFDEIAAFLILD